MKIASQYVKFSHFTHGRSPLFYKFTFVKQGASSIGFDESVPLLAGIHP